MIFCLSLLFFFLVRTGFMRLRGDIAIPEGEGRDSRSKSTGYTPLFFPPSGLAFG